MFNVNWRKARHFLLWAILVVPLLVIFVFSAVETETFTACVDQKNAEYTKNQFQENGGILVTSVDTQVRIYSTCAWDFVQDHDQALVALGTLLLAIFTLALWVVTGVAARAARDSANALPVLERAYVFIITEVEPSNKTSITGRGEIVTGIGSYKAGFLLFNNGKTPATLLEVRFCAQVVYGKDEFPEYPKSLIDSPVVLAAGEEFPGKSGKRRIIDPPKEYETIEEFRYNIVEKKIVASDETKIIAGEAFIIVLVKVVYRDIFKTRRETVHCRLYNGKERIFQYHGGDKYNYST